MTPQQAKEKLRQQGITARQFADQNGLSPTTVYLVLRGVNKGNFGEGHRAAVALGIKKSA